MARLDVSDLPLDPMFTDTFDVERRTETVDNHGRSTLAIQTFPRVAGTVTMASPNDLKRLAEHQVTERTISIVTKFKMQGEVTGKQPDVVVWRGDRYVVNYIDYYPQFGRGFTQVLCSSMDRTDEELNAPLPGGFAFNQSRNSALIQLTR